MPFSLLDKAYTVTDADGIIAYRAVVPTTTAGECKLPTAANQFALGVTTHAQLQQNHAVAVRRAGIAVATAAGAISIGAPVNVAGTTGKVKALSEAPDTLIHCLGFAETAAGADGDLIDVFLAPHTYIIPKKTGQAPQRLYTEAGRDLFARKVAQKAIHFFCSNYDIWFTQEKDRGAAIEALAAVKKEEAERERCS